MPDKKATMPSLEHHNACYNASNFRIEESFVVGVSCQILKHDFLDLNCHTTPNFGQSLSTTCVTIREYVVNRIDAALQFVN